MTEGVSPVDVPSQEQTHRTSKVCGTGLIVGVVKELTFVVLPLARETTVIAPGAAGMLPGLLPILPLDGSGILAWAGEFLWRKIGPETGLRTGAPALLAIRPRRRG